MTPIHGVRAWFHAGTAVTRHAGANVGEAIERLKRALMEPGRREELRGRFEGTTAWVFLASARRNGFELGLQMDFAEADGSCAVRGRLCPYPTARTIALLWVAIGGVLAVAMGIAFLGVILTARGFPAELLLFGPVAAAIVLPFMQIRRGVRSAPTLARFFDEVFPG